MAQACIKAVLLSVGLPVLMLRTASAEPLQPMWRNWWSLQVSEHLQERNFPRRMLPCGPVLQVRAATSMQLKHCQHPAASLTHAVQVRYESSAFWQCQDLPNPPFNYAPKDSMHIDNYQQCGAPLNKLGPLFQDACAQVVMDQP